MGLPVIRPFCKECKSINRKESNVEEGYVAKCKRNSG
jgi:hypothetical protein